MAETWESDMNKTYGDTGLGGARPAGRKTNLGPLLINTGGTVVIPRLGVCSSFCKSAIKMFEKYYQ